MKLLVIIASTRPGRIGKPIGDWFADRASQHGGFEVEVADLAEIALPLHDEPAHPMTGKYEHQHTKDWSARVDAADAVVMVTPEYNYAFNAALKNAIDYLNREWRYKPVGFVSYGGVSGGMRAVQMLKQVVTAVRMVPVGDTVLIPMARTMLGDGGFEPTDVVAQSADVMLDELVKLAEPLAGVRAAS
ncbi:NAD(P)H-dependent FMN reductase [Jatrophihabitans endophyticus]|uniref:NAD(P)H-dependent FMN reductase n=1 Tax=Jatrophihabitans endophyticus TaxID=1206085 RepID=A0A1M5HHD0_9ACTN|nr:NAD(P)H-dependent oxidoreductase [Jatrophihabitans endophyticus]SHG15288.1 NAD(P)H-dependent FMN reductase [Jatrophihabitans endophyticus]